MKNADREELLRYKISDFIPDSLTFKREELYIISE